MSGKWDVTKRVDGEYEVSRDGHYWFMFDSEVEAVEVRDVFQMLERIVGLVERGDAHLESYDFKPDELRALATRLGWL